MATPISIGDLIMRRDAAASGPDGSRPEKPALDAKAYAAMIDNVRFQEFVIRSPDSQDISGIAPDELETRFNAFKTMDVVANNLAAFVKTDNFEQLGIKLPDTDLESVRRHVEDLALENPEELRNLGELLAEEKKRKAIIAAQEKQLAALGNKDDIDKRLAAKREEAGHYETVSTHNKKGTLSRWYSQLTDRGPGGYTDRVKASQAAIEDRYKKNAKGDVSEFLRKAKDDVGLLERASSSHEDLARVRDSAKEILDETRKSIFEGVSDVKEIGDAVAREVKTELEGLLATGTVESLDKLQGRIEKLKAVGVDETSGIDPLREIDDIDDMQEQVDQKIKEKVAADIRTAVETLPKAKGSAPKLVKAINAFLDRNKIGSAEGDAANEFVRDTVAEVFADLSDSPEDRIKKFLLAQILRSHKSNKTT